MSKRSRAAALLAAALASLAIAVPAGASAAEPQPGEVVNVSANLWIAGAGSQGRIRAANPNCVEDRRVVVRARGQGVVARTTTDDEGFWRISRAELLGKISFPSRVYAEAPQVSQGTAGPIYRCLKAVSRTVTVTVEPGQTIAIGSNLWIADVASQGRVRAANDACVGGRKVQIKVDGVGTVAGTTTDAGGTWRVDRAALYTLVEVPAKFYAVVLPETQATAGPIYRCQKGTSRTVWIR